MELAPHLQSLQDGATEEQHQLSVAEQQKQVLHVDWNPTHEYCFVLVMDIFDKSLALLSQSRIMDLVVLALATRLQEQHYHSPS